HVLPRHVAGEAGRPGAAGGVVRVLGAVAGVAAGAGDVAGGRAERVELGARVLAVGGVAGGAGPARPAAARGGVPRLARVDRRAPRLRAAAAALPGPGVAGEEDGVAAEAGVVDELGPRRRRRRARAEQRRGRKEARLHLGVQGVGAAAEVAGLAADAELD